MAVAMSYQPHYHSHLNSDSAQLEERGRAANTRWDDDIVPALRRRLEGESKVIAKRMSGQSFASEDDFTTNALPISKKKAAGSISSSIVTKPSGIPRPSLSHENYSSSDLGHSSTPNTPRKRSIGTRERARTISTPQPYDHEYGSSTSLNEKEPYAPPPPRINGRDPSATRSRIPRPNNLSNTSPNPNLTPSPLALDGTSYFPTQTHSQELLSDTLLPYNNSSPRPSPLNQPSNLLSQGRQDKENYPRPSMESDKSEHEYEHWYRGDISRSGGVGELKTGRRKEMLDIANYGHAPTPIMPASPMFSDVASSSRPESSRALRRRASLDSIHTGGAADRNSVYIEDDSINKAVTEWVIDEMPLTDGEWSGAENTSNSHSIQAQRKKRDQSITPTPTQTTETDAQPVRYTLEMKQGQLYGRRPIQAAPTGPPGRSFTAPVPSSSSATTTTIPPSTSNPTSTLKPAPTKSALAQKRTRTQSSAAAGNKNKKQQMLPKKTSAPSLQDPNNINNNPMEIEVDENGRPLSMINAIPTWREPILKEGAKWDEVVLPAVAARMGLEGYQEVNGNMVRRPRQEEPMLEPAPGTFGYDHSKYRPPRPDEPNPPLPYTDDFGMRPPPVQEVTPPSPTPDIPTPPRTPTNRPPPLNTLPIKHEVSLGASPTSPAPFSRYNRDSVGNNPPRIVEKPARRRMEEIRMVENEKEPQAGCCGTGCVIM